MGNAFDGAGKPYRGPSWRGPITVLVVSLVVIVGLWLAYSNALRDGDTINPIIPIESPAPTA